MNDLAAIIRNKILPLLEEYFFEDWRGIQAVLGEIDKDGNAVKDGKPKFINDSKSIEIFGIKKGAKIYYWDRDALTNPDSYTRLGATKQ